jgi:hypothetical protein
LIAESREFVKLVARGMSRTERHDVLVLQNGLGRRTYKSRRNIFEQLEARFLNESHARDLGVLAETAATSRTLAIGMLNELVATDDLVRTYVGFVFEHVGQERCSIDASRFIGRLSAESSEVASWAPSLHRRAASSLNSLLRHFMLNEFGERAIVTKPKLPLEVVAFLIWWQLEREASVVDAPLLRLLSFSSNEIVNLVWDCARRGWFEVVVGASAVPEVRRLDQSMAAMLSGAIA